MLLSQSCSLLLRMTALLLPKQLPAQHLMLPSWLRRAHLTPGGRLSLETSVLHSGMSSSVVASQL